MSNGRIKRYKSKDHVTINSAIMREKNVSLKAKGLYALVMSLPDTWDFSLKGICAITKENYTAINNSIKELIEAGYCRREFVKEHGKFVGCDYAFSEVKGGSPCLGFLNTENLNSNNNSIILNNPIKDNCTIKNSPVINKEENILSDDNKKSDDLFNILWSKYKKGGKKAAIKAWGKLSPKQRESVLANIDSYLLYCKRSDRPLKDVSTYLNGECFNDDWEAVPDCYKVSDFDDDRTKRFKEYMVKKFPDLIYHRNPLTFEQCYKLIDTYGTEQFEWAMGKLAQRNIHQYFSINSGVEGILKDDGYDNE